MRNKYQANLLTSGYIGIVMLLIGVLLITLYVIRTDILTGNKDGQNMIEQGKTSIDAANDAKKMIEQNNRGGFE